MPEKSVDKWKQKGHLYLWQYVENTRNYPGWNLTADSDFRDSFLDLIQKMSASQYNCRKTLNLSFPTIEILKIPNNQGGMAKWISPQKLIINYHTTEIANDGFSDESENSITLSISRQKLELLKDCLLKIRKKIDYSIEIGNTQIWFW